MALRRPEGLSPCYMSLASPDIPDSVIFKWTFRGENSSDYQSKYTITIKDSSRNPLHTYTQSSSESEIPFGNVGFSFSIGTTYYWSVTVYGKSGTASLPSVDAKFKYDSCPELPPIAWNHIPQQGDVVVSNTYFQEIRTNVETILNDYEGVPFYLISDVRELFTEEVVPSRKDFGTLEDVIAFLSTQLEDYYSIPIEEPVEDSLGVSDLEKIRQHIDSLASVRPKPVEQLEISVGEPTMYKVYGMTATSNGKADATIDLRWNVEKVPSYSGRITIVKKSPSKDVRYYRAVFEYGPSNNPFASIIYYPEEQINDGTWVTFDTDWDGLYTKDTLGLAKQSFQIFTVDHRGNVSSDTKVTKTYGSNFKAPLGVDYYEAEVQRAPLGDNSVDPNGTWYWAYEGSATSAVRTLTGGEGQMYFRVRAVDYSGIKTDWTYSGGITFDPLKPPATPRNFRAENISTNQVGLYWSPVATAEEYQVYRWLSPGTQIYRGPGSGNSSTRGTWATGLSPANKYNFYVRAGNRAGWSDWASLSVTTKSARKTTAKQATKGDSWRSAYYSVRNGRLIEGSKWRSDDNLVYQGEWCEIEGSPNQSGPAGQCWGKHKGMWIFDDNWWRSTLQGKKIIKVEIWIHRKGNAHGYYNDQVPTFWLHNYDTYPKGEPSFFGKFQPGKEFDLGEKAWVTLPNWYGEYIRDGKAKGIGIYRDKWGKLPYIKYYPNAQLRITYE